MSTKDEKDWLRAILEGRVKPGDAEWERIWQDENFTGVRRVLREVGMRKKDELVADREKMWRAIKQYRGEGINRRRVPVWRWVAAAMLPLLLGGILWINLREKKDLLVAEVMLEIEAGTPRAVLFMEQGERIDLSLLAGDTILNKGDVRIRLDSSKSVTYEQVKGTSAKVEYNTIVVPRKGEYQLILADGSKVYLNSGSSLVYPAVFAKDKREVYLDGEAYFEVSKEARRKFVVQTAYKAVEVLGTKFNVSVDKRQSLFEAVLVTGKIGLESNTGKIELIPNQYYGYDPDSGQDELKTVDTRDYISWIEGRLRFNREPLDKVIHRLEKSYNIKIEILDSKYLKYQISGNLDLKSTPEETMNVLMRILIPGYNSQKQKLYQIKEK